MDNTDKYKKDIIEAGDKFSQIMAEYTIPTIEAHSRAEVLSGGMNHVAVMRPEEDDIGVAVSASGDPKLFGEEHVSSMINNLENKLNENGAELMLMSNVIEGRELKEEYAHEIGKTIKEICLRKGIANMNGESAGMGNVIIPKYNISGTGVGLIKEDRLPNQIKSILEKQNSVEINGIIYFKTENKPITINSDGNGTKTVLNVMAENYKDSVFDFMAMNLDDAIKIGAEARVLTGILEVNQHLHSLNVNDIINNLIVESKKLGIEGRLSSSLSDRVFSYKENAPAFTISGSTISLIDENILKNLPHPLEGDKLVVIYHEIPDPRANGITLLRQIPFDSWGLDWHEKNNDFVKQVLNYASSPSKVLYPMYSEMFKKGFGNAFYHMSGGTFNGKLAKPLAKYGLHANIEKLPEIPTIIRNIINLSNIPHEKFYDKWPMIIQGFVATTNNENEVIKTAEKYGFKANVVTVLNKDIEKPGVDLVTYKGERLYFNGK